MSAKAKFLPDVGRAAAGWGKEPRPLPETMHVPASIPFLEDETEYCGQVTVLCPA